MRRVDRRIRRPRKGLPVLPAARRHAAAAEGQIVGSSARRRRQIDDAPPSDRSATARVVRNCLPSARVSIVRGGSTPPAPNDARPLPPGLPNQQPIERIALLLLAGVGVRADTTASRDELHHAGCLLAFLAGLRGKSCGLDACSRVRADLIQRDAIPGSKTAAL